MQQVNVLEAHPLDLALVETDLDLLAQAQDASRMALIEHQAIDPEIGLMNTQLRLPSRLDWKISLFAMIYRLRPAPDTIETETP